MKESTLDIVRTLLKADETVTPAERQRLVALLKHGTAKTHDNNAAPNQPRILRRKDVAERLGRSIRVIDRLCKAGVLRKVTLPDRTYGAGILESSLNTLLQSGGAE